MRKHGLLSFPACYNQTSDAPDRLGDSQREFLMRHLFVISALLLIQLPVRGALDPETKSPYRLQIVLRFVDHPHFTEHFRRELKRDLTGSFQAALGNLGTVDVVDMYSTKKEDWPPLWKLAADKGLEGIDQFHEASGGKTHFLWLTFADDQYEIQARQHDGTSGFVTPIVRKAKTHDRGFVSRLAGLLIHRDFGFVATLEPQGAGERVFLKAKAGGLGPIEKWVKKGEVFAVVAERSERRRVTAPPNSKSPPKSITIQTGNRVEDLLLQVTADPTDGIIPCRMYHRYEEPLPRGVLGFRCVKLGTSTEPLRLQLLDPAGLSPKATGLNVHARSGEYPEGDREAEQAVNHNGAFVSKEPFAHLALVRVLLGNRRLARIPVEIIDDRVTVRTIRLDPAAELRDRLDTERRGLLSRLTDGRLIQVRCFQEIAALEQAGQKGEALERGQAVLRFLEASSRDLQEEIDKLQARAVAELPKADGYSQDCERQLQILRGKQGELRQHLEALQTSIAEDSDPQVQEKKKKVQDLIRAAELFVTQAEYDKALAQYEAAMIAVADEPAAKLRIEGAYVSLKKAWQIKPADAGHAAARKFIVETWPRLATPNQVRDQLATARQSFEKCKAVGDRLAINKMQQAAVEVVARFGDELKRISDAAMDDADRKALEAFQKVNEDLIKLLKDVQDYVLHEAKN